MRGPERGAGAGGEGGPGMEGGGGGDVSGRNMFVKLDNVV